MYLNLGNIIKEQRLKRNMTQETLASALGVTSQAVSRWESGSSYPDMELISPIANFFGITIDQLFGYHDDAFTSLDNALKHAKALESLKVGEHKLTAPLVSEVTLTVDKEIKCVKDLPADFPWYQLPPHKEVTDIMKQDPRFIAFVNKTLY